MLNEIRIDRQVRQTKKDATKFTIFLRVHLYWAGRKDEFVISTKCCIEKNQWNSAKKCLKGTLTEASRYNKKLRDYEDAIHEIFEEMKRKDTVLYKSKFKALVNFKLFGIKTNYIDTNLTLPDLFDRYVNNNKSKLGESRKGRYRFVKERVCDFTEQEYNTRTYDINELSKDWYDRFREFMMDSYDYGIPTLTGYLKVLRAVVKDALNNKLIKEYPFLNCKLEYADTDIRYLTNDELQKIKNYSSRDERLQMVSDCFVFASQTGLSHTDLSTLTNSMIRTQDGKLAIFKKRNKTNVESIIPINKLAKSIIDKYRYHPKLQGTDLVLPVLYINDYNTNLKIIAAQTGIDGNLTSHMARHTFATTVWLNNKGTLESLQKILGHNNIRTTQRYGRITSKRVLDESLSVFNDEEREFEMELK